MKRSNGGRGRAGSILLASILVATVPLQPSGTGTSSQGEAAQRMSERLRTLQREADELASRETTLIGELRQLELRRQMKTEELAALAESLRGVEQQVAQAAARDAELREAALTARPDLSARLVRLYKMGHGGYWRLLLEADDIRSISRTYRVAAALTHLERTRADRDRETLESLGQERARLAERAREARAVRDQAAAARAELDRAVAAQQALVASIDQRRDLAAQLASELAAAQRRLQETGARPPTSPTVVSVRPLEGELPWPAQGILIGRFGQSTTGAGGARLPGNGIEISLPEGRPVAAVHEGLVTFAGALTGFGSVVILDHGQGAQSLYGHLSSSGVNKGDRVNEGDRLGTSGRNTAGNPSLYFELRIDGRPVDPLQWLRKQP